VPARQQTLRNTIDWSYGLLAPEERRLFARLSVFAGGCTFEAAEAVCNAEGDLNLLADMATLVDKNLLRQMGEEPRFSMLETIREYANERLEDRGEAERVRRAHAVHLLELTRLALPDAETGAIPYPALDRLEREHDNLRAALAWAEEHDPDELGLPLAVTAASFWEIRDYYGESRQWIECMLARVTTAPQALRARAVYYLGSSSVYLGDYQMGLRRLQESLALYRTVADQSSMILVLSVLGGCLATNLGRPAAAIPHLREAVNLARVSGPPYRLARALRELGWAMHLAGESKKAIPLLQEALEALGEAGDGGRIGPVYQLLGAVALGMGDRCHAEAWFHEGLIRSARAGDRAYIAMDLEGLAQVAAENEQWERAARIWGAADSLRTAIRMPVAPVDVPRYQRWLLPIAEHLGESEWARLQKEGQAMTVDQAVTYALDARSTSSAPSRIDPA
jgi:non-specific serine/threonine protein kinase